MISTQDRTLLRDLAKRVAEIAAQPEQEERKRRWIAHNRLEHGKPMILCSPEGAWGELLPDSALRAEEPQVRAWERNLRTRIYIAEHFHSDQVIDDGFGVSRVVTTTGWGLDPIYKRSDKAARGSYVWEAPVRGIEDLRKLRPPETTEDKDATERNLSLAHELVGDILKVRLYGSYIWSLGLIGELARLRGLEQIMLDMIDNPDLVHTGMRILMEGRLQWLQSLEERGMLSLNNGCNLVASGGFGCSDELPAPDYNGKVRLRDQWGFAEAQEISDVSPAMHDEFVLTYQIPILERYGLACYGCCEPLHRKLDLLIRKIPRLRRISISPWCDTRIAAEKLGDRFVFSWKPNPAHLASVTFDPVLVRNYIRETLETARGCIVEMTLKDTHTCNNEPQRFDDWTRIAREEVERISG